MGKASYGGRNGPHQYAGGLLPGWLQLAILVVVGPVAIGTAAGLIRVFLWSGC